MANARAAIFLFSIFMYRRGGKNTLGYGKAVFSVCVIQGERDVCEIDTRKEP
jgi:hypothetical protein